jgi:hypothetical protein
MNANFKKQGKSHKVTKIIEKTSIVVIKIIILLSKYMINVSLVTPTVYTHIYKWIWDCVYMNIYTCAYIVHIHHMLDITFICYMHFCLLIHSNPNP